MSNAACMAAVRIYGGRENLRLADIAAIIDEEMRLEETVCELNADKARCDAAWAERLDGMAEQRNAAWLLAEHREANVERERQLVNVAKALKAALVDCMEDATYWEGRYEEGLPIDPASVVPARSALKLAGEAGI